VVAEVDRDAEEVVSVAIEATGDQEGMALAAAVRATETEIGTSVAVGHADGAATTTIAGQVAVTEIATGTAASAVAGQVAETETGTGTETMTAAGLVTVHSPAEVLVTVTATATGAKVAGAGIATRANY
jgi:hypothetical protein